MIVCSQGNSRSPRGCMGFGTPQVERTSRFTMLVKISYDRCTERVTALLARKMETLPEFLRNSMT